LMMKEAIEDRISTQLGLLTEQIRLRSLRQGLSTNLNHLIDTS
jgi:hypothetical protein